MALVGYRPVTLMKKSKATTEDEKKKEVKKIFPGKDLREGASLWSLLTHSYAKPVITYANENEGKLKLEQMGELPESVRFESTVPEIEAAYAA